MYFILGIITGVIILFIIKSNDNKKVTPVTYSKEQLNADALILLDTVTEQLKVKMVMGLTGHYFTISRSRWTDEFKAVLSIIPNYYPTMTIRVKEYRDEIKVQLDWSYPLFKLKEYQL